MRCSSCRMPALIGGIIGGLAGAAVGMTLWMVWYFTGQLTWKLVLAAPFLGCVWGIFGGFAAGAVPTEHRWSLGTHRLLVALLGALGGGTSGFGFGLLIDKDRGLSTATWTLL